MHCGVLVKDTLDRIPSKALHIEVDAQYSALGLRFCSGWFHRQWTQYQHISDTLAVAFSPWMSGEHFEEAVLATLPYWGTFLFRRICRETVSFERCTIPLESMVVEKDLTEDQIYAVSDSASFDRMMRDSFWISDSE